MAPLTLLVGENSTGKTSFLAMVRALREVAFESEVPDFQEPPYDLGTFSEIAHNRVRGGAKSFEAGFSSGTDVSGADLDRYFYGSFTFSVIFEPRNGVPYPTTRRLSAGNKLLEVNQYLVRLAVSDRESSTPIPQGRTSQNDDYLDPLQIVLLRDPWINYSDRSSGHTNDKPIGNLTDSDMNEIRDLTRTLQRASWIPGSSNRVFAGAPVRSTPKRTYDPARPFEDPGGQYIPTLLVNISRRDQRGWGHLKGALDEFGKSSGLFDEVLIESLGKTEGSPFQLHIRKSGGKAKGRKRNLIDVGYGVSQILPVLIELLREDHASMFLLQQPEVHLHPTAQAALGSLFCEVAGWDRQVIVETHSDYIIDRVRMDVRDKKTNLKPEDVSILYFEPDGLDVRIHSLELDEDGNILNAPSGYRQFFMDEMRKSIGL